MRLSWKRGCITYSEAFKMKVVEEIGQGGFATIAQAQKAYGICGMSTIQKWVRKYGRPELLPKRVRVETMTEIDERKGMDVLTENLGIVDAERFISLILREPFNYTEWQQGLYEGVSLDEFCDNVKNFKKQKEPLKH